MAEWVEVNGVALRYALCGEGGPSLALIHELSGMLESWDGVVARLAAGRRILRYDLRGFGLSEKIVGAVRLTDLVDDLATLLGRLEFPTPVTLAGSAIGAAVALGFAARHPERASGVVAMAPALGMTAERRPPALAFADRLDGAGMRAAIGAPPPDGFERRLHARRLGVDPRGLAAYYRMLAGLDMTETLANVSCPVLLLAGESDALRPPGAVRPIARGLARGRMKTIPAGHFMHMEAPDAIAAEIAAFMEPLQAGARS